MRHFVFTSFLMCFAAILTAQQFQPTSADQIFFKMEKLNVLGNAMYLAAHPDDENTRLITYFTHEKHFNTTYLSLTRGDGGQNLIGTELGASLGVLRTEELLRARSIDGGNQWFTRANDFGFSKHPDETLHFWNEAEILKDMVNAIRKFRPDVIVNRFTTRNPGETHGHHSASAILADKAIVMAADPNYKIPGSTYPAWQVTNMYFNTSYFFYKSQEEFEKADKSGLYKVDCGLYYPLVGMSNGEIAAQSRSSHRCQGFGSAYSRGSSTEYLELIAGKAPVDYNNPFAEINSTWSRVKGGKAIAEKVNSILKAFDYKHPDRSIPALIEAAKMIEKVEDPFWKKIKSDEINSIILDCAGFYFEAVAGNKTVCQGDSLKINAEYISRSSVPVSVTKLTLLNNVVKSSNLNLADNNDVKENYSVKVPDNIPLTTPYWLQGKSAPMMYDVRDRDIIGRPENAYPLDGQLSVDVAGYGIAIAVRILYKNVDPAYGQRYGEIQVVPPVSVNIDRNCILAHPSGKTALQCTVKGFEPDINARLYPDLPKGWTSEPQYFDINMKLSGESREYEFMISGPSFAGIDSVGAHVEWNGKNYNRSFQEIKYEHVPYRIINIANKVPVSIVAPPQSKELIGYIDGAGDLVFESLKAAGYNIERISPDQWNSQQLARYRTILIGIRAFNILDNAAVLNQALNEYAANGGRVVVQYVTSGAAKVKQFGPYPFIVSRTRVTDETADVHFLLPEHILVNKPNKITAEDFRYWVQERGLYFGDKYDDHYQALFGMHDKDEAEAKGSLLYTPYGKGSYIYTGLVFYRELPAGIPGAYRLMENLLYNPQ